MLHAALLLWVAGAGHLLHGNVDLHAMAWLLVGSIPGVLLGSHLSIQVPGARAADRVRVRPDALRDQARRAAGGDDDHRGRRRTRRASRSRRGSASSAPRMRRLAAVERRGGSLLTTLRRIARPWPGSCRRRSSLPCSRRLRLPSRSPRARSSSSRRSPGPKVDPLFSPARSSGEADRAHPVPAAHPRALAVWIQDAHGRRVRDAAHEPHAHARARSSISSGTASRRQRDLRARRRLQAGREARALAPHDRAAEPDPARHEAAGDHRPQAPHYPIISPDGDGHTTSSGSVHAERAGARRSSASAASRSSSRSARSRSGELVWNGKLGRASPAGAPGPVPAHGRRAATAPATSIEALPFAIAQVRYLTLARERIVVAPGGASPCASRRMRRRCSWRLHGRSGVAAHAARCTSARRRRPASTACTSPRPATRRQVVSVVVGMSDRRRRRSSGGASGRSVLALLLVATRRDLRIAGLAAWAIGCGGLVAYLAPPGHHRVLARRQCSASSQPRSAARGSCCACRGCSRSPTLACVPARIPVHVGSTQANLLLPLYGVVAVAAIALAWELSGEDAAVTRARPARLAARGRSSAGRGCRSCGRRTCGRARSSCSSSSCRSASSRSRLPGCRGRARGCSRSTSSSR